MIALLLIACAQEPDFRFETTREAAATARVVDQAGVPLPGAILAVEADMAGGTRRIVARGVTDASGEAKIRYTAILADQNPEWVVLYPGVPPVRVPAGTDPIEVPAE